MPGSISRVRIGRCSGRPSASSRVDRAVVAERRERYHRQNDRETGMRRLCWIIATWGLAIAAHAQTPPDPTSFANSAEVRTVIAQMAHDIKPAEDMLYHPLLTAAPYTIAV